MKVVEVKKKDFEEIIDTANELVERVESALSEEEIAVKERLKDVKKGYSKDLYISAIHFVLWLGKIGS